MAGLGEYLKKWDPLLISTTAEGSNFKFGTQRGFGEYVTITALVPNLVGACWSTGAPQKLCGPGTMYPVPRNSCRNVIKLQIYMQKTAVYTRVNGK